LNNTTNIALNKLSDGIITTILEDSSGLENKSITRINTLNNKLGLASWGDGLFVLENSSFFKIKTNCIGFNTVSCIAHSNGKMWFGSGILGAVKTRKGTRGVSNFDGSSWQTFTVKNSPMISDNVLTLSVDDNDRIWMGSFYIPVPNEYGWERGVNVFNQQSNIWDWINGGGIARWDESQEAYSLMVSSPALISDAVSYIYHDSQNRMFVCCYNGGVLVMDSLYQKISSFQLPSSAYQRIILVAESNSAYFFGTANDYGLSYWTDKDQLPDSELDFWHTPPPLDLNNCWVYGVVSFMNDFGENEVWIAASNGVYSFDGTHWFKYDVDIKRRIYRNSAWETDINGLYYFNEDRLFGSVHTSPTAIFLDPFRRIWLGSVDNGFSMYDPSTERFTNYNITNSPLISNYVVSFGYDPVSGSLYIGTPDGLNSFQIGIEQPPQVSLKKVIVFPNPFKPDQDQQVTLQNTSSTGTFPPGKNICRIYDLSGDLVTEVKQNLFYSFTWDGRNSNGKKCSTGVYFYVIVTADGDTARGKIALIRG